MTTNWKQLLEKRYGIKIQVDIIDKVKGKAWNSNSYLCKCPACLKEFIMRHNQIVWRKSCGCRGNIKLPKNGINKHPLRSVWKSMILRCHNPIHKAYKYYGARGISVCDRWKGENGLLNFAEDMGLRPSGTTLDRINSNLGYFKENCRWATAQQQQENKRNVKWITFDGHTDTIKNWTRMAKVHGGCFNYRIKKGMSTSEAIISIFKIKNVNISEAVKARKAEVCK